MTRDDALVDGVARDPLGATLPPRTRALVDYAAKLTRAPATMGAGDLEPLRAQGLDDRAILDLCQVVAYFNFVNRMAHGLGVELEAEGDGSEPGSP